MLPDNLQTNESKRTTHLPIRKDVIDLLKKSGVEFFRIPISPEGEAMIEYFRSSNYIHCHFTPAYFSEIGSAIQLLSNFISKVHSEHRDYMTAVAQKLLASEGESTEITSNRFRGVSETGQWCWYEIRMSVRPENGLQICEGLIITVEEQEQAREKLERVAYEDNLTGLPNTSGLCQQMERLLRDGYSDQPEALALIWIDLSGFSRFNYLFGRANGDALLTWTAQELRHWLQDDDILARPSSDEFAIVLPGRNAEAALAATRHLQEVLASKERSDQQPGHRLTFNAGISSYPQDAETAEDLISQATTALDHACRSTSRDQIICYVQELTHNSSESLRLEQALQKAIERDELHLAYQPQVNERGELIGHEALIRWQNETYGEISPATFIPLAEETGLIHSIGQWVIVEACRQQAEWQRAALDPPAIGINISPVQLESGYCRKVEEQLFESIRNHQLVPGVVQIEITESAAVSGSGLQTLWTLHEAGIPVKVDDFGTGFASLSALLKLPIHTIKVDQSFVSEMSTSEVARGILRSSIKIAQEIGADVVVEGVETTEQFEQLKEYGYRNFQGYFYSIPLSKEEATIQLEARKQARTKTKSDDKE